MSEFEVRMAVPLDPDGFVRRACPNCEREFKCIIAAAEEEHEATAPPPGGYHCPYCGQQGPANSWWTEAQLEAAKSEVFREVVRPELERFAESMRHGSGDFLSVDVEISPSAEPPPLTESGDMRWVDFECHPSEPVKVLDDWGQEVHCMICGRSSLRKRSSADQES